MAFSVVLTLAAALAAKAPVEAVNKNGEGIAIKGYDPVAYFTKAEPVKGSAQFAHHWMGATWWFATAEDRDLFVKDPDKCSPQFGGYCSWAVSNNNTADIDPTARKIVDGKLYLNYSKSVQKMWEKDLNKRIEDANRNWPALHK